MNAPSPSIKQSLPRLRLFDPSRASSPCVLAYISCRMSARGGEGSPLLSYFPFTPSCALVWTLEGQLGWGPVATTEFTPLPGGVLLRGPQRQPFAIRSSGPVRVFICLLMMPDALREGDQIDLGACVDRIVPLSLALGEPWQDMARSVQAAATDVDRVALIEAFLAGRRAVAGAPSRSDDFLHWADWLNGLVERSGSQYIGRSTRQTERRIKSWSGSNLRDLRYICRAETAFFRMCSDMARGRVDLASLAQEVGYADQAHFCRAVKRASGFSPAEFLRRLRCDEAFWAYRLWRQRLLEHDGRRQPNDRPGTPSLERPPPRRRCPRNVSVWMAP